MKNKILVCGADGQVGQKLCSYLNHFGQVYAGSKSKKTSHYGLPHITLDFAKTDAEISQIIQELDPQYIVNAAAFTQVDLAEDQEKEATRINTIVPSLLAKASPSLKGFIHFSTDYVYNPKHNNPISEEEEKNPCNIYGKTKLLGDEKLLTDFNNVIILRTSWVYGQQGKNFVNNMIDYGKKNTRLTVANDQWGAPTYARDLGLVVFAILSRAMDDDKYFLTKKGVYNCCNEGHTNWYELALKIFDLAKIYKIKLKLNEIIPVASSDSPTRALRPKNSRLNISKLNNVLKIEMPSWETSLHQFFDTLR